MASSTKSIDYRMKYPELQRPLQWHLKALSVKKSVVFMLKSIGYWAPDRIIPGY